MSGSATEATGFTGFAPQAMQFFRDLEANQNKEWMASHKADYEQFVKRPLETLVVALSDRFASQGVPLSGDPKHSLFRLNRDVRFSADKRPYNDHASAALGRDGDRKLAGLFYLQLAPTGSFAAAGFFRPEPDVLHRLREAMVADRKRWATIAAKLTADGLELDRDDVLVRHPKGFEDAPDSVAEDLKLKSWTIRLPLAAARNSSPELADDLVEFGQSARELLEFGWKALR